MAQRFEERRLARASDWWVSRLAVQAAQWPAPAREERAIAWAAARLAWLEVPSNDAAWDALPPTSADRRLVGGAGGLEWQRAGALPAPTGIQ